MVEIGRELRGLRSPILNRLIESSLGRFDTFVSGSKVIDRKGYLTCTCSRASRKTVVVRLSGTLSKDSVSSGFGQPNT